MRLDTVPSFPSILPSIAFTRQIVFVERAENLGENVCQTNLKSSCQGLTSGLTCNTQVLSIAQEFHYILFSAICCTQMHSKT